MTHVRFVRHGEVAAEHKGTFYGCAEVALSEHGLAESRRLARVLAADPPARVLCSPLRRAHVLAAELASLADVPLHVEHDLRELDRGDWTHLSRETVEARWPRAIERYLADPEGGAAPGGETESVLNARVWGVVERRVAQHAGERLVVVAHGHVLRVIMRRLLGWTAPDSLRQFVPYHGIVEAELTPDGHGRMLTAPATHLPEALDTPAPGSGPTS